MKNEKIGRNDPCPCGSGYKYKKCCFNKKSSLNNDINKLYYQKYNIRIKNKEDIEGIRKAGQLAIKTLDLAEANISPGITTDDINTIVHEFTIKNNAVPAPLGYKKFPKSVCVSVNEVICHGIPGEKILKNGDIVNIDVTPVLNGYFADASKTFFVGTPNEDAKKIVAVTKQCLKTGMEKIVPGNTLGDIGWAIQKHARENKCSVVREFVGHGIGHEFHEPPQILHYGKKGDGVTLIPGMVFTIEPMINLGSRELYILEDQWTAVTVDGSLSAQFEQTLLVTEHGYESLTPFDLN